MNRDVLPQLRELIELAERVVDHDTPLPHDAIAQLARGVLDLERGYHRALSNCAELRERLERVRKVVI